MSKTKSKYEDNYKEYFENLMKQNGSNATPKPLLPTNEPLEPVVSTFLPPQKEVRTKSIPKPNVISNHDNKMMYEDIKIDTLPLGKFYHTGTRIQFRDLKVSEIEHFSTLDESSDIDFVDKLNDILESCVLFTHPDGSIGSYLDIKEGDRPWIIYMIRERTFPPQKSKALTVKVPYIENGEKKETEIEFRRENIEIYQNEDIMDFYDSKLKCLVFETILRDEPYYIAPPTIGLKRCFDQYLKIKVDEYKDSNFTDEEIRDKINAKFIMMAPYLKPHITYMSYEDIEKLREWFENMSAEEYSFFYELFKHELKLGIRGLKKNMGTTEVRHNKVYPNKRTAIFIIPNAFRLYIRK